MTIRLEEIVYLHCHQQGIITQNFTQVTTKNDMTLVVIKLYCAYLSSELWWDSSAGEPRWNPETSPAFSQRGSPAAVSYMPRDWPASSWSAGPSSLESKRKGYP